MSGGNYNIRIKDDGASGHRQVATKTCSICKTTIKIDTEKHSREGPVYTCGACTSQHSTAPSSSPQTVTKSADTAKPVYKLCDVHKNSHVRVYCVPCGKPLCAECQVQSHLDHKCVMIEHEVDKVKAQLEERKNEFQERLKEVRAHTEGLQKRMSDFQKVKRSVKDKLDAERQKLEKEYEAVDEKNEELAENYLRVMKHQVDESKRRMTDIQGKINEVQKLIKDMQTMARSDCLAVTVPTVRPPTATAGQLASPPQSPQLIQRIDRSLSKQGVDTGTQTCADDLRTPEASAQISNPGSTEGKIRFRLQNVGQVGYNQDYYSEETTIADIPWSLQVERGYVDQLYVGLHYDRHSTLSRSEFNVDVEFSVSLMHPDAGKTLTKKFADTFSTDDWCGTYLCPWKNLGARGFIIDNSITFEADVKVKSVSGIPA